MEKCYAPYRHVYGRLNVPFFSKSLKMNIEINIFQRVRGSFCLHVNEIPFRCLKVTGILYDLSGFINVIAEISLHYNEDAV